MNIELSLIIPAYNEEARMGRTLDQIQDYIRQRDFSREIIVVSDGSRDRTPGMVREKRREVPELSLIELERNRGKGFAVRAGVERARGRYVLFSDADLSTPIDEFDFFLPLLEQGAAVVIGSRGLPDSRIELHQNWYREGMGKFFNLLVRNLVIPGIRDTQCGFKAFQREVVKDLISRQRIERFSFDVELLFLARKLGYPVREVPVRWINSPQSRVRMIRDSGRMALDLLRIRWYDLREEYGT